jgi:tyrosyl-tRNA synthetase
MDASPEEQLAIFKQGAEECLVESELLAKLKRGKPLRVKLGADPTAPDLHLGHSVVLTKMRQMQDLGHHIIFLIGDFTGMIGDPTGRNTARPPLSIEQIQANAATYEKQVFKILDREKTEIAFNSTWSLPLGADGMIKLAATYTLARLMERDDFSKRWANNQPISIHELLYPLAQGYDSVALKSDIEMGGTDQKFNLIVGRELQKHYGQEQQCLITMPLLEGLDGVDKMSKSKGNVVGLFDPPGEMFGKLMSVSDELMWRYFSLLSTKTSTEIARLKKEAHPRDAKVALAQEMVARYHAQADAERALADFEARFKDGAMPENMPEVALHTTGAGMGIAQIAKQVGLVPSTSEAFRLIDSGGLRIDGEKVSDRGLICKAGTTIVLQAGKRKFVRVTLT